MIERDPHLEITNEIPDSYINGAHVSDSSFPDRKTKNQLLLENDPEDGEEEEEKDEEEIDEANPVEKILKKTSRKKVAASSKPIEVKEKANNEPESDSDKSEDPDDILKDL